MQTDDSTAQPLTDAELAEVRVRWMFLEESFCRHETALRDRGELGGDGRLYRGIAHDAIPALLATIAAKQARVAELEAATRLVKGERAHE